MDPGPGRPENGPGEVRSDVRARQGGGAATGGVGQWAGTMTVVKVAISRRAAAASR